MIKEVCKLSELLLANSSTISSGLKIASNEGEVLSSIMKYFRKKSFLMHQAQRFDQFSFVNA